MYHHTWTLSTNGLMNGKSSLRSAPRSGQLLSQWPRKQKTGIISESSTNVSGLYKLLLTALSVAPSSESSALAIKTIQAAISLPQIYDLEELASLPTVKQFQTDKNPAYEFLQVFLTGDLETYRTFIKSHPSWLADNRILLTLFMLI